MKLNKVTSLWPPFGEGVDIASVTSESAGYIERQVWFFGSEKKQFSHVGSDEQQFHLFGPNKSTAV